MMGGKAMMGIKKLLGWLGAQDWDLAQSEVIKIA